jgi:hypothetical protein
MKNKDIQRLITYFHLIVLIKTINKEKQNVQKKQ